MNVVLWILQFVLALHTAIGAVWKFGNAEKAVPSLAALPHAAWLALIPIELLCCLGLVAPAFRRSLALLAPVAAGVIAAEMLLFTALHAASGVRDPGPAVYWLIVAALCAFVAIGRRKARPVTPR